MLGFALRRVAMLVGALLASSFVIFAALDLAPGDPIATLSGQRALPPEAVSHLRAQYHLDDPFLTRYWAWLTDALHGNLGTSIAYREPVSSIIEGRTGTTVSLVLYATLLIVVFGIGLGLVSALRHGWLDTVIVASTAMFAAIPSFVAASILLSVFTLKLGWFPAIGSGSGGLDTLKHLTLPAVALALSATALVVRITRSSIRAELEREHVQTAISRGIRNGVVVRRHVLRNAAIPVTTVVGITIASLIALCAVVEQAFALDGLGSALVQAALAKDIALVQGIALVLVTTFLVINTVVDLLYAMLDPRVVLGSRAA